MTAIDMTADSLCARFTDLIGTRALGTRKATLDLGLLLASRARSGDVFVLAGPLGAGKTTLTQGLGDGLGVRGPITSPTFVLSRVHPALGAGPALVHVDAYRLDALEVDDIDLAMSTPDAVFVIEWGAGKIASLTDEYVLVELDFCNDDDFARRVSIEICVVDQAAASHVGTG